MLHYNAVNSPTLELLKHLMQVPSLSETRLVGGTSLALQIGHRQSIDIEMNTIFNLLHIGNRYA
jgi:hypothetical protein